MLLIIGIVYVIYFFIFMIFFLSYYFYCTYSYNILIDLFYTIQRYGYIDSSVIGILLAFNEGAHLSLQNTPTFLLEDTYSSLLSALHGDGKGIILLMLLCHQLLDDFVSLYVIYTDIIYYLLISKTMMDTAAISNLFSEYFQHPVTILNHSPYNIEHIHIIYPLAEDAIVNMVDDIIVSDTI